MPEDYESGASAPVAGASRSLEEVTVAELMGLPPTPARPEWMVTRFPVDMEEWHRLELEARKPDPQQAVLGALEDTTTVDQDQEVTALTQDPPEGEIAAVAPIVAAPSVLASFDGISQTAWQPPDNTIA